MRAAACDGFLSGMKVPVAAFLALLAAGAASGAVSCRIGKTAFPTYGFSDPDPVPAVAEKRYPYFRYDGSTALCTTQTWRTVVLENDRIRVTLMPDIGGKVWGATDRKTGVDFVYYNHAVKFRDIAMRGPWCSGGIEYNFGIIGHAPSSSTPVDWCVRENADGSASFFAASAEYITRSHWQVEVRLAPGADAFETRTTWYNASGLDQPYYHWMNAGFPLHGNPRFFFPGSTYIGHQGDAHPWPRDAEGRELDVYRGNAFGHNKSYHILPGDADVYAIWWPERGVGAVHRAESWEKYGRKIWLWALSREGGIWEDLLTDSDGQYTELQSGRCFNQPRRATYRTPFKHPLFSPGATERFTESWGVLRSTNEFVSCRGVPSPRPATAPGDFDWTGAWGRCLRGEQHLREREDAEAEACFREALSLNAHLSPALAGLAAIELRRGAYAACHGFCRRALAVDAYDASANYLDGFAFFAEGDLLSARDRLGVAAFDPRKRSAAYALVARTYLREGDAAKADAAARKALAANDANFDALLVRLVAARGTPRAKPLAEEILAAYPLFHAARYELEGDAFSRHVRNELPHETYLELGSWYAESGFTEDARAFFARAGADRPLARIRLAHLAGDAAALDAVASLPAAGVFPFRRETLPALRWAAEKHASWKFRYYLAVALAAFRLDAEADGLLDACAQTPDEAVFYQVRAARRTGAARLADLMRAKELGDDWRIGRALCRHHDEAGDQAARLAAAEDYVARYPDRNPIQIAYADALVKNGRCREAMDYLKGVVILPSEYSDNASGVWHEAQRRLGLELTYPENLGAGEPYPEEDGRTGAAPPGEERPYEIAAAGRTADAHPALVDFETPRAWRVDCRDATGTFARAQDRKLFGEWTGRLVYRAEGKNARVRCLLEEPVALPGNGFDTMSVWVRSSVFTSGANRVPFVSPPRITALFRLADGTEFRQPVAAPNWMDWHMRHIPFPPAVARKLRGGSFAGFEVAGGTPGRDWPFHFDSLCFFEEELKPLAIVPRPKRNLTPLPGADQGVNTGDGTLPFPTREETILPDVADPLPGEPLVRFAGGAVAGAATNRLAVRTKRVGRTLIVDFSAPAGAVTEISAGFATEGRRIRGIDVPFLTYHKSKTRQQVDLLEGADGKTYFRYGIFDWYRSNASTIEVKETPKGTELSVVYGKRSDGRYNPVSERLFITLSPDFAGVLPNIPNPTSPWKHVTGRKVWRAQASYDRALDRRLWRTVHRCGMRELMVTDHEPMWRSGGESFTLRTSTDPKKGGDAAQYAFTRFMRDELGFSYGPYNNFTDFAPVNANWDPDLAARRADRSFFNAWMRCYRPRPVFTPELCVKFATALQEKFRFDTAYCDVHTAIPPWAAADYDARVPGAGTFSQTFYAWGETLLEQRRIWNGPVWSEGPHQFLYAGITDGNYGQDRLYVCAERPWIVDFAVLKINPLETDFGMGWLMMFRPGKTPAEKAGYHPHAPTPQALTDLVDRYLGATLAFGHSGFLILDYLFDPPKVLGLSYGAPGKMAITERGLAIAMRSYFMTQQIAARYTQSEAVSVFYADAAGNWLPTSDALRTGDFARSQVKVVYRDGTTVVSNGSETERLTAGGFDLPPCGYHAASGDGEVVVSSDDAGGVRADYCASPAYIYIDGRGAAAVRGKAKASGTAVCRTTETGWEIIPLGNRPCAFRIPGGKATALDEDGKPIGPAATTDEGGWFSVRPVPGAFSYAVEKRPGRDS